MKEVICFSQCDLKRFAKYNLFILTEILHHSQLAFYEQAFRPVPQENRVFVQQSSCLFHKKIESLWNRPDSLLLTIVPVPQENRVFVEQAGQPVADNDEISQ